MVSLESNNDLQKRGEEDDDFSYISRRFLFYFATPLPAVKDTRAVLYLCKIGNSTPSGRRLGS